MVTWLPLVWS